MHKHLLTELSLPDRYETLESAIGSDIARILVAPSVDNISSIQEISLDVTTRSEGVLVPVYGETGVGKTTFVRNINQWLPFEFGPTIGFEGNIEFDELSNALTEHSKKLPANNDKIISINIDHRENNPPSDAELSTIKRFLRTHRSGAPSIIFWPETNLEIAQKIAARYINVAGEAAVPLPLTYQGPPAATWTDIAKHTLALSNRISDLDQLGIDPNDYNIAEYRTLGAFLRKLSRDFNRKVLEIRRSTEKPLTLVIVFASESSDPGVLSQLTSSARYGLLDAHALISVTSQSVIGKWWSSRRGLLTRAIVQLDAHAICLAPTAAASCIRNFSTDAPYFDAIGYNRYGPARGVRDLSRSDLGKIVAGDLISRFEARGTPAEGASEAFAALANNGFNLGKDKGLNEIMKDSISALLESKNQSFEHIYSEKKLPFCSIIPDNSIHSQESITCVEYTWRKGDFLSSKNRSTVAQYILTKLRNYARELGWTSD